MKVRFRGTPNMLVSTKHTQLYNNKVERKPLFRFDEDGFFITEDDKLIKKLKGRFDYVEIKEEGIVSEEEEKPTESTTEPENDISELSYNEMKTLAKEKGIKFEKNPTKVELLEVLRNG